MLVARTLKVLALSPRKRRLALMDESVIAGRVWPGDLDMNLHMNNGRYLALMDLGRVDLLARIGALAVVRARKWFPIVGSTTMRYRRSLELFERFEIRTRVVGWDAKWFFIEQRFVRRGETVAVGLVKGLFRGPDGNVPSKESLEALGHNGPAPPLPPGVAAWVEAERLFAAEPAAQSASSSSPRVSR